MRSLIAAAVLLTIGHLTIGDGLAVAQPAADREPTITVQGAGRVQVPPDHANLTVEVVTKGKSLDAATASHRDRTQRAVGAIQDSKNDGVVLVRSTFRLGEMRSPPPPGRHYKVGISYRVLFENSFRKASPLNRSPRCIRCSDL